MITLKQTKFMEKINTTFSIPKKKKKKIGQEKMERNGHPKRCS